MLILATGLVPMSVAAEVPLPPPSPAPSAPGLAQPPVESIGRTPPRLSFISGDVSFWRPGADDWAPAVLNTALAPGDYLYAGQGANLELQIDGRAFVRAAGGTQLALTSQDLGFVQLAVSGGLVALDIRELPPGYSIEVGTPAAALTIDQAGYYLAEVQPAATAFTIDRGGRAMATVAGGTTHGIGSGQQVVVRSTGPVSVETLPAPAPSDWDRWNYARTDALLAAQSAQYVPLTMYGASDLDRYGTWRVESQYGPVWVPQDQPAEWVPYSTGRWMWDPYYGWTWVDDAPWGWAPYHYGRWVFLDRAWAWVPGPLIVRPAYAPALVAFFGYGGAVITGAPVGWVALGWGEPIIPWWGPAWFVGRPCWVGWYGPRVVNNVVITKTTIVNATDVKHYRNTRVVNAVVAVPPEKFGTRHLREERLSRVDLARLHPVTSVPVTPSPASFVGTSGRAVHPPAPLADRRIVTRRALPEGRHEPRGMDRDSRAFQSPPAGPVVRSSEPTVGDRGRPTTRSFDPRPGPPQRSIMTPPPPPVTGPAEPRRSWTPGRPRGDERPAATAPGSVIKAPQRPPATRQAPERAAVPPHPWRGGGEADGGRIVKPPAGNPGWQVPGGTGAAPQPQQRRMDWPQAPHRTPGRPSASPAPKPTFDPVTPERPGLRVSPRAEWSEGQPIVHPAMRPPAGRGWSQPRSTGVQGRHFGGGDRGQRGKR
jgi:hypothetical protein